MVLHQVFALVGGSDILVGASVSILLCSLLAFTIKRFFFTTESTVTISVNYHFTRKCNRECGFCFHTEKVSLLAVPKASTICKR